MKTPTARSARHSSVSVEWYTPPPIVEAARATMGGIDLDPASCAAAQRQVKAHAWAGVFGPAGPDGLAIPWHGRIFLNPPGGRASCGKGSAAVEWWSKLCAEYTAGRVTSAVFVGFSVEILQTTQSRSDCPPCLVFPVCLPSKRIRFWRAPTPEEREACPDWGQDALVEDSSPTHANAIVYLPPHGEPDSMAGTHAFANYFRPIGAIVRPL